MALERATTPPPTFSLLFTERTAERSEETSQPHSLEELARALTDSASDHGPSITPPPNSDQTPPLNVSVSEDIELSLVSDTLAEIMVRQGKFDEARKVYIQLSRQNPSRLEYYQNRMAELEAARRTSP